MPSYEPAKKNTAYVTYVALIDQASGKLFKGSPTLAAGDVTVSIDGGAFANITTLPTVTPAAGKQVKVSLSASEMNGDNIGVLFSDVTGAEWNDLYMKIPTVARQFDDLAFPTVSGRSIDVATTGEVGLDFDNVKDATGAHTLTNITVPTVTSVTNDVGITQAGADKVWGSATRTLTAFGFSVTLTAPGIQAIWDALSANLTTVGSIGKRLVDFVTGDAFARLGAPAGASIAADIAAVKSDTGAVKAKTDSLTFTVAGMVDSNVVDWKGATAPAMTGDAFARLGAPAGASVSADIAAIKTDTGAIKAKTDALPAAPAAVGDIPTALQNADALLNRDMSAVSDTNLRSPLNALRRLRNKNDAAVTPGSIVIYKENDSTTAYVATLTTDGAALPVTVFDPTT